uniref:Uncharacterized protein n=1 Tax=Picea sitchensis TaxID=3332 RepID=A9NVY3_PICSI|nr:unknown [Picea sitchensis]
MKYCLQMEGRKVRGKGRNCVISMKTQLDVAYHKSRKRIKGKG